MLFCGLRVALGTLGGFELLKPPCRNAIATSLVLKVMTSELGLGLFVEFFGIRMFEYFSCSII